MIPLLLWAVREIAEDIAEDQAKKIATSVADSVLASLGDCTLTEDELTACADANAIQAAVLDKVKAKLSS